MTNADRIRAMSDEELAVFLSRMCPEDDNFYCRLEESCQGCWRKWLRKEADNG